MIEMSVSSAARAMQARWTGNDVSFRGCSTDSRSVSAGQLFIAIKGERFDGHDYLDMAREKGAAAALVARQSDTALPCIQVNDVRRSMGELARYWRQQFLVPLIAITGSNGKTTVKEMLGSILRLGAPVLSTQGNLNNDIGVPLTLYGLAPEHAFAVIEMGANHPGEIGWLSHISAPTVAVITQCAPAHLEGFGSVEGVARAKAEIFDGLEKNGTAIINADDDYAGMWREKSAGRRQISFGLDQAADVTARPAASPGIAGNRFTLQFPGTAIDVELPLPGRHNCMNALAAASCAFALEIDPADIKQGLENMQSVKGRLQVKPGLQHSTILDDTYNANPASLQAALHVLTAYNGRRWLVLGDMGELGADSEALHRRAGEQARETGVEKLFALGPLSRSAVEGFGSGARHFESIEALINTLREEVAADVHVLVKGSRSMQMERVVRTLEADH